MTNKTNTTDLWTPRSSEDTRALYSEWAASYDADITAMAYATPDRVAKALLSLSPDTAQPILDFGCGTGLSGLALHNHGFSCIDGTDITPEMLDQAHAKATSKGPVYRKLWQGKIGEVGINPSDYNIIIATGVISMGAAPPEMLAVVIDALAPDGLLAFSYNDPTLADPAYMAALAEIIDSGKAEQVFREYGPHLNEKVTGSDVIILKRL